MLTVFWSVNSFKVVELLINNEKFNSEYFTSVILEKLKEKSSLDQRKGERKLTVHYDNARPHTARKVFCYLVENRMMKAPHHPFSPDVAPSDFFLFGNVKFKINGLNFDSPEELLDTMKVILDEIPQEILFKVFDEWEIRLKKLLIQVENTINE